MYLYPNELAVTSYPGLVPGLRLEDFAPGRRITYFIVVLPIHPEEKAG